MPVLDELVAWIDAGTTLTAGTDLFYGAMPETPDDCVTLFEAGGPAPEHDLGTDVIRYERPRVQVRVRYRVYATGRAMMKTVRDRLVAVANENLSGVRYIGIDAIGEPQQMGRDGNDRWEWVCTFQIEKAVS